MSKRSKGTTATKTQSTLPPAPVAKPRELPKLRTIKDVAEMLGVSESSIYREIRLGKLVSIKIGAKRQVSEHDLWAYLQVQRKNSQPKPLPAKTEVPPPPEADPRQDPLPHMERGTAAASA